MGRGVIDVHHVERDHAIAATHVRKRYAGAKVDFNSIAQGFTVDLVMEWLLDAGIQDAMVEIGGEVRCAGVNDRGEPWHIAIDQPLFTDAGNRQLEALVAVSDMAICTSGSYRKFYEEDGVRRSHTINPETGYPVQHALLSATIRARTAAVADALATACMVMGPEKGKAFVEGYQIRHPEEQLEAVFLIGEPNGGWTSWQSGGWGTTFIPLRPASIES
jgi:thiamine biosynthesis lipoprotein